MKKVYTKLTNDYNIWMSEVMDVENEHIIFKEELQISSVNYAMYYVKLIAGLLACVVSILWWI